MCNKHNIAAIVGTLSTIAAGNRYIAVAVDHLSKLVEVATVPCLAAGFVIKILRDHLESKHGLPKKRSLRTEQPPTEVVNSDHSSEMLVSNIISLQDTIPKRTT